MLRLLLWLHALILPCSCEEKGLVLKVKGTSTSDAICGKCLLPRAGLVQSRELLVLWLPQRLGELAWPVGVFGRSESHRSADRILPVPARDPCETEPGAGAARGARRLSGRVTRVPR